MRYSNSELLTMARTRLLEKGWIKGHLGDPRGRVCAMGAVHYTLRDISIHLGSNENLHDKLLDLLSRAAGVAGRTRIPTWNDAKNRNFNEILAAFDEAILLAKEEERDAVS